MIKYHLTKSKNRGFALLLAIVVVGTVVSVGLTILDITLKQLSLSTSARDSEIAFHVANAAAECARYWRGTQSVAFESGVDITGFTCFGAAAQNLTSSAVSTASPSGSTHLYQAQIRGEFNAGRRCADIRILTINPDFISQVDVTAMNSTTLIPGYPQTTTQCPVGGRCTVISVQGYNRDCPAAPGDPFPIGTVQREVLLEL